MEQQQGNAEQYMNIISTLYSLIVHFLKAVFTLLYFIVDFCFHCQCNHELNDLEKPPNVTLLEKRIEKLSSYSSSAA